jgi:hypothetical protein
MMTRELIRAEIIRRVLFTLKTEVEKPERPVVGWPKYGGTMYNLVHEDMMDDFGHELKDEELFKRVFDDVVNPLIMVLEEEEKE